jgi:RNA polymerase sigma factor (sigma-70 family)
MGEPDIANLQHELRSGDAAAAWESFLRVYSPVVYQSARAHTSDEDDAGDCFVHVCEQLAKNRFRRLLKFKPQGSASFTTWLRVVARNLCYDWHRRCRGRQRPFKSIQSLPSLELEIYRCRFERGFSEVETLNHVRPMSPDLDQDQLADIEDRIELSLSFRHRKILSGRRSSAALMNAAVLDEQSEKAVAEMPSLSPECLAVSQEQKTQLQRCVSQLPVDERLLLQLKFEEALSLEEIARVMGLGDAQRVHRRLAVILQKLRRALV